MKKAQYDKDSILDTAMQIIQDEHKHFVNDAIDNEEHIPRILRIADSAGKLLSFTGISKREVEANIQRIIHYGRQLFIEEWMMPISGENDLPNEQEAIDEFEKYLKTTRKAKRE